MLIIIIIIIKLGLLNKILEVLNKIPKIFGKTLAYGINIRKDYIKMSVAYAKINYLENPRESMRNY
jgi:hypothetical protein